MIVDIVFGFLGSGKTTFITRILNEWGDRERIVVLVNEFGEVGIDGDLLTGRGGEIVEMPSGCICCTLQSDFRSQMLEIIERFQPQRLLIEPTGVATISQVQAIVGAQMFEKAVTEIRNILIVDAGGFMGLYKANPHFVESQVTNARAVLLNKCDLVAKRKAALTRDAISAINPEATVLMTEFGAVEWEEYQLALSAHGPSVLRSAAGLIKEHHHGDHHEGEDGVHEGKAHHVHHEPDALGYESVGLLVDNADFDPSKVEQLFSELNAGRMGDVVRAKGIFKVGEKSVLVELASGECSSQPVRPADTTKLSVIGKNLNRDRIETALGSCVVEGAASH